MPVPGESQPDLPLKLPLNPALNPNQTVNNDSATEPPHPFSTNFIWPPPDPNKPSIWMKAMNSAVESCVFKAAASGAGGYGLGLFFGLFFGGYSGAVDKAVEMDGSAGLKLRVGMREAWKAMASNAKTFGRFGLSFSAAECTVEKLRARHDLYNPTLGGCVAGAVMAAAPSEKLPWRARATQMGIGCASVGAFSAAIDYYMEYME